MCIACSVVALNMFLMSDDHRGDSPVMRLCFALTYYGHLYCWGMLLCNIIVIISIRTMFGMHRHLVEFVSNWYGIIKNVDLFREILYHRTHFKKTWSSTIAHPLSIQQHFILVSLTHKDDNAWQWHNYWWKSRSSQFHLHDKQLLVLEVFNNTTVHFWI